MGLNPPEPPADQLDWHAALSWLPTFTADGFDPGGFAGGEEVRPDHFNLPYAVLAPEVEAFVACLYDTSIVAGTDWPIWLDEGGQAFLDDPSRIADADLETCRMLLITHVRGDRFSEGHLLSVLRNGDLVAVLERIRALVEDG